MRDKLAAQIMLQSYLDAGCPEKEAAPAPLSDQDDNPIVTTLIIGCGYLGQRVGALLAARGERVSARFVPRLEPPRSPALGIEPVVADVLESAFAARVARGRPRLLLRGVRPVRGSFDAGRLRGWALERPRLLCRATCTRIVYASSTGVYGQTDGEWVDEATPAVPRTESGKVCLEAEERLVRLGEKR